MRAPAAMMSCFSFQAAKVDTSVRIGGVAYDAIARGGGRLTGSISTSYQQPRVAGRLQLLLGHPFTGRRRKKSDQEKVRESRPCQLAAAARATGLQELSGFPSRLRGARKEGGYSKKKKNKTKRLHAE